MLGNSLNSCSERDIWIGLYTDEQCSDHIRCDWKWYDDCLSSYSNLFWEQGLPLYPPSSCVVLSKLRKRWTPNLDCHSAVRDFMCERDVMYPTPAAG